MESFRSEVVERLFALISNSGSQFAGNPAEIRHELAKRLEQACYDESQRRCGMNTSLVESSPFSVCYHMLTTNIMYHCDGENQLAMLDRIYHREIALKDVTRLNYRELDPSPTAPEYDAYVQSRNEIKVEKLATTIYLCPKCKAPMDVRQIQMRGLDEPATLKTSCLRCQI